MTPTFQIASASTAKRRKKVFFQVDIEDFDLEVHSFQIEATSAAAAAATAQALFDGDIYNMNIYGVPV